MKPNSILKFRADARPVILVLVAMSLNLLPVLLPLPWYWIVVLFLPGQFFRSYSPFAQHNHGHVSVFRSEALNFIYDVILAQLTGYPTTLWILHHNRGHHRLFLDPMRDPASVIDLATEHPMPRWWYALKGNVTIWPSAVRIGFSSYHRGGRELLGRLLLEVLLKLSLTAALLCANCVMALAFFVGPNLVSIFRIWWDAYPQHLDLPSTSVYDSSITNVNRLYNHYRFNLGHHAAHHKKPDLHWSLLPAYTDSIRHRIPLANVRSDRWG